MLEKRKIFGLNRNIFILGLTSFFNDFSNEMILSAFPAFFTSVLKSGAASLGLVEGIADGAANFLKIYSGNLSDRLKKRVPFIFIGYGLSVIIRPFYMIAAGLSGSFVCPTPGGDFAIPGNCTTFWNCTNNVPVLEVYLHKYKQLPKNKKSPLNVNSYMQSFIYHNRIVLLIS